MLDTEATPTPGRGRGWSGPPSAEVEDALVEVVVALTGGTAGARWASRLPASSTATGERVRFAPHLPWRDEPLPAKLGDRLGGRIQGDVLVDNDATAALWAEARFGAARDVATR